VSPYAVLWARGRRIGAERMFPTRLVQESPSDPILLPLIPLLASKLTCVYCTLCLLSSLPQLVKLLPKYDLDDQDSIIRSDFVLYQCIQTGSKGSRVYPPPPRQGSRIVKLTILHLESLSRMHDLHPSMSPARLHGVVIFPLFPYFVSFLSSLIFMKFANHGVGTSEPLLFCRICAVKHWASISFLRSEVLTVVKMSIMAFGVVIPCGLLDDYQRFGGTCRLHLQGQNVGCLYRRSMGSGYGKKKKRRNVA
jgi:hypothetical protein